MITLVLVISVIAFIVAFLMDEVVSALASAALAFFSLIYFIITLVCFTGAITIDEKIEMYRSENAAIEERIGSIVNSYMQYESDTYAEFSDNTTAPAEYNGEKDDIFLVTLYPELKTDTLILAQISTYFDNHQKILELENTRIQLSKCKFALYFGH